jgi:ribosome biogenesis GTPase A
LCGRASAKTGDRPGVTTAKQWLRIAGGYELLDTPGILWPKFDEDTGLHLAYTGAIRDEVYDIAEVACKLCAFLAARVPDVFAEKYKLESVAEKEGHELLFAVGKKRGCLIAGGDVDYTRAARIVLDEFRGCKLGNITLELPE